MKSQRRHDLQANTLADSLAETVEYIKDKSQAIIIAVAAVIVVISAIWYWQYSAAARREQGWQEMLSLIGTTAQQDPQYMDKLALVAESYRDPGLRAMAYDQLGNELLQQASFGGVPADKAADYRDRAQAAFTNALNEAGDRVEAAAIARMGLAAISADKGDIEAARQYYEAVRTDARLKGSPYPAQASTQLAALEAAGKLPPLAASAQPVATKSAPATQPEAVKAAPATQPSQD